MTFPNETSIFTPIFRASDTGPLFENAIAKQAYGYFCEMLEIPRGSGNENALSAYLMAFAEMCGLDAVRDESRNVLIKKPGGRGRENERPVILQAHIDMVCEKNEGVRHDFLKDPISVIINGDWVKAAGTTLGADNAGGLSLIMAVLASDIAHPPIEAIFTAEEETTMGGAWAFDVSRLSARRFINLDSESEGVFTVSSAGASDINVSIPVEYEITPEGFESYKLMVRGLTGGHSGVDINRGRANANVLAARLLSRLEKARASSIDGGSQKNAIPRECTVVISFDRGYFTQIKTVLERMERDLRSEYPFEEGFNITLQKIDACQTVMSFDSQQTVISGMLLMPDGVLSMSADIEGLVQTSNNLGVVKTDGKTVRLTSFFRSSDIEGCDLGIKKLKGLMEALGAEVEIKNQAPPWEYKENSPLRDTMTAVFKEFYGKDPKVSAIHAGLECAVFAEKIPDCDFISIGMDIRGAHSPDEKMSISSFDRTGGYLAMVLTRGFADHGAKTSGDA